MIDDSSIQSLENEFRRNYSKLFTLAFRMSGNRDDAEDILQNSFLSALKGIGNFRGDSSLYTWLYRIVVNSSRKYGRDDLRLPVAEYAEEHSMTEREVYDGINRYGMVEEEVLVKLTKENCLQMFMNCIPSQYRVIYTLRVILSLTVREAAEILQISESLVKVNLHTARKLIAAHFEGRCSLMGKGKLCDCRSYAAYILENGRPGRFVDLNVIHEKEQKAVAEFYNDLKDLLEIEDLYERTTVESQGFDQFHNRIKKLIEDKTFKLLS